LRTNVLNFNIDLKGRLEMRGRDLKLCVFAVVTLLLGAVPAKAVPIVPGGQYLLVAETSYDANIPIHSFATHTYKFDLSTPNPPWQTISSAVTLPTGGSFQNFKLEWFSPLAASLGSLLITNSGGNLTFNADLVVPLSITGIYTLVISTTGGTGLGYIMNVTTTPLPPALILFGTALAGLTWLGRRRRLAAGH
jgi:hypothetical protein